MDTIENGEKHRNGQKGRKRDEEQDIEKTGFDGHVAGMLRTTVVYQKGKLIRFLFVDRTRQ